MPQLDFGKCGTVVEHLHLATPNVSFSEPLIFVVGTQTPAWSSSNSSVLSPRMADSMASTVISDLGAGKGMNFIKPEFRGLGIALDKSTVSDFKSRSKDIFAAIPLHEARPTHQVSSPRDTCHGDNQQSPTSSALTTIDEEHEEDRHAKITQDDGDSGDDQAQGHARPKRSMTTGRDELRKRPRQGTTQHGLAEGSAVLPRERPGYKWYTLQDVDEPGTAPTVAAANAAETNTTANEE